MEHRSYLNKKFSKFGLNLSFYNIINKLVFLIEILVNFIILFKFHVDIILNKIVYFNESSNYFKAYNFMSYLLLIFMILRLILWFFITE